jgi:hypothetical protein
VLHCHNHLELVVSKPSSCITLQTYITQQSTSGKCQHACFEPTLPSKLQGNYINHRATHPGPGGNLCMKQTQQMLTTELQLYNGDELKLLYFRYLFMLIVRDYDSELRPPMGLLFTPRWQMSTENHGGMILTGENSWFLHHSSGNSTSSHLVAEQKDH